MLTILERLGRGEKLVWRDVHLDKISLHIVVKILMKLMKYYTLLNIIIIAVYYISIWEGDPLSYM